MQKSVIVAVARKHWVPKYKAWQKRTTKLQVRSRNACYVLLLVVKMLIQLLIDTYSLLFLEYVK